jgi:glycerol-3-phosphate dehydrogenase
LETRLILRSAQLRDPVLEALAIPVLRCGATMPSAPDEVEQRARVNGVPVQRRDDGSLEIPGESVTDPVAYALALGEAATRLGARVHTGFRVAAIDVGRASAGLELRAESGDRLSCRMAINCAGLHADEVARLVGDEDFAIYPRKGEFLVFAGDLDRILLPVPTKKTKGVLVFPTLDGRVVAGPTAIEAVDKRDWSVRPEAPAEILRLATVMHPPLEGAELVGAYAGLRPAGRDGANYVIGASRACPRLVNVAAIRSTGLTASLGIAEYVARLLVSLGGPLTPPRPLAGGRDAPPVAGPWWRRTAAARA